MSKSFPGVDTPAVDHVDLAVARGEFLTFLGPSGSGKTTTLNMIAGFLAPSSGRILLEGRDIATIPPYKRNLGMVFQNYALFPHMTAWHNVAFPLVERRTPKESIAQRVQAAFDMVGLTGFERRRPRELSGGQQQRVALARALVFDPPLLLMDEPLGALDKKLRSQLQLEIKRVHRDLGITFLFVTHDQEEAMALSDTIVVFNEGRIEQIGSPSELYRRPSSRFVAEFLGESNLVEGVLAKDGDRWLLSTADGMIPLDDWTPPAGPRPGDKVCFMFRPESVRVTTAAGGVEGLKATIKESVYLGAEHRVLVETPSGATYGARVTGDASVTGSRLGDTAALHFDTRLAWMLPASS